jgi:hypothetical protein
MFFLHQGEKQVWSIETRYYPQEIQNLQDIYQKTLQHFTPNTAKHDV